MIQLSGIGRTVDAGGKPVSILRGVDLTVGRGDLVGVVGASGSGKSSLLNIIGLLDQPSTGTYLLGGVDVVGLPPRERDGLRSRTIGFVFQSFHLIDSRTVLENVALGLLHAGVPSGDRANLATEALAQVGMADMASANARTLSGGEKQRVAIARAISGAKDLLLCDEPTGNLDSVSTERVIDLLVSLHGEGRTVVIVTHDPSIAALCPTVVEMSDGRLRASLVASKGRVTGA